MNQEALMALAERKLGPGATIRIRATGWVAQRGDVRVTGKTRNILEWFLKEMPDAQAEERA